MKVGLNTVDLFPGRERLMPFRTVIEIAKAMRMQGIKADVLNSHVASANISDYIYHGINIRQCPRELYELSKWVNTNEYDVFFFPATFREGLKNLSGLKIMKCKKIAYVPSGVTPFKNAFWLMKLYGLYGKQWMLEAITPKTLIAKKLANVGFTDIIGLTNYTTHQCGNALKTHTIYAGKDDFEYITKDTSIVEKHKLQTKKFYLFTGAPGQVRGGLILLEAIDKIVKVNPDIKVVFLLRDDVGTQYDDFFRKYKSMQNKKNVLIIKETLDSMQLKAFMHAAYAVVLPFICIPAEIPLTYYEAMSIGIPIVSFPNAGSTMYLEKGIMIAKNNTINGLSEALSILWNNISLRNKLSQGSISIMAKHPTWQQVSEQWIYLLK